MGDDTRNNPVRQISTRQIESTKCNTYLELAGRDLDKVAVRASDTSRLGAASLVGSLRELDGVALTERAEAVGVDAEEATYRIIARA
jgi:hypothetical protein